MRIMPLPLLFVLVVGCTGGPDDPDSPPPSTGEAPVLVVADGRPGDEPGLSVTEALTHGPTDDLVTVIGALFIDAHGVVRLCDAIAESFPPQCGGDRIVIEGLDLSSVEDLQEANGVRWSESVRLLGSVE